MNLQLPTARRADIWTPAPLHGASTKPVDFQIQTGGLYHVEDPTGQNRRYFEGWASLVGLDMQKMELAADACRKGAQKYLSRNPVLIWHHQAEMPIGRVESLTFTPEGMYVTGVIDNMQEVLERWAQYRNEIPLDSIALKCEEVWQSLKSGTSKSLSVRGGVRDVIPVWSPEFDEAVPRVLEVELYEISVTPISIHPGTKITSINTVAKALGEAVEVCKALALQQPEGDTMSKIASAWEQFQAALAESADENGNVELPTEVEKGLQAYGSNIEPSPKSLEEQLAEQAEVIKSLQERLDGQQGGETPAPRRGYASVHTPAEAKVKPTGAPTKGGNVVEKALSMAAETYRGKTGFGEGDRFTLPKEDVYKVALVEAQQQGHMAAGKINLSPRGQQWVQSQLSE